MCRMHERAQGGPGAVFLSEVTMRITVNMELLVKRAFRSLGLELQRLRSANTEEAILLGLLDTLAPEMILDVGANAGQYAHGVRALGYRGRILSFEALPSVHAVLEGSARSDGSWDVAPCAALGAEEAMMPMNVAGNLASSSLLEMSLLHAEAAPESAYIASELVPVRRLDDARFTSIMPQQGPLFLKIDTQGYEKQVLEGAKGILSRVTGLQLELSLVELYKGAPRIAEMIAYVETLGFELFNMAPGFKDKKAGQLLQVDGFFIRRQAGGGRDHLLR